MHPPTKRQKAMAADSPGTRTWPNFQNINILRPDNGNNDSRKSHSNTFKTYEVTNFKMPKKFRNIRS